MMRLRLRLGRWLLAPHVDRVVYHYEWAAKEHRRHGNERDAIHCDYIAIGASYVMRWTGHDW